MLFAKYSRGNKSEIRESAPERSDSRESENASSDLVDISSETEFPQIATEESDSYIYPNVKSVSVVNEYSNTLCAKLNDLICSGVKNRIFVDLLTTLLNFSITSRAFTITNEMHMIPALLNYLIHWAALVGKKL